MATVIEHLVTAGEFERLPCNGKQQALVRGVIVETMPPGGEHGGIAVAAASLLRTWVKSGAGGFVGVESGFVLQRNPDTVRAPDVYYVRAERIPATGVPKGFWTIAPDVAVEVVSPSETADEVRDKVRDYLQAGTPLVWVVYARTQEVIVHTPDGVARTYGSDDVLEGIDVLPGFACTVAELFS